MRTVSEHVRFSAILALCLLTFAGCSKKDQAAGDGGSSGSSGSGSSGSSAADNHGIVAQGDSEAAAAMRDELTKHWVQTPDGWISEFPSKVSMMTGERAGPESFYRELKDLNFEVQPDELSDSDKLNGIQFSGICQFDHAPKRIYGDPNAFGPVRWSDWEPSEEAVRVTKKNGQWHFADGMGYMVFGTKPAASTIAQLK